MFQLRHRPAAGEGLDPPHPSSHTRFGHHPKHSDLTRVKAMSPPAQLLAEGLDAHHPNLFSVLVTEEGQSAGRDRFLDTHDLCAHRIVHTDVLIDDGFNLINISRGERLEMRKIEPQPVGRHE